MVTRHEYINDFLYVVVRSDESRGARTLLYCSGVNLDRFAPLTKGRHGLSSNPVIRGLQIVKQEVSSLILSKGGTPRIIRGKECAGIAPTADTWYSELLLIEDADESLPAEIIDCGVRSLFAKIFISSTTELQLPDKLPDPGELQQYIDALCRQFGRG
ncbi:MAG: hypothetical protein C0402_03835 [Thermodesulfovibrio sp.]|nr:hypothetical protein [Thermodesulfovibrio sp.]